MLLHVFSLPSSRFGRGCVYRYKKILRCCRYSIVSSRPPTRFYKVIHPAGRKLKFFSNAAIAVATDNPLPHEEPASISDYYKRLVCAPKEL